MMLIKQEKLGGNRPNEQMANNINKTWQFCMTNLENPNQDFLHNVISILWTIDMNFSNANYHS